MLTMLMLYTNNGILFIYHNFLIYSSISGHLGCSHVLAIAYNAATNMRVQVPFQVIVFTSLGYIPRSRIPGSNGEK